MKKLIAALLSLCLLASLTATPVFAAPSAGDYTNGSTNSAPQDDDDDTPYEAADGESADPYGDGSSMAKLAKPPRIVR